MKKRCHRYLHGLRARFLGATWLLAALGHPGRGYENRPPTIAHGEFVELEPVIHRVQGSDGRFRMVDRTTYWRWPQSTDVGRMAWRARRRQEFIEGRLPPGYLDGHPQLPDDAGMGQRMLRQFFPAFNAEWEANPRTELDDRVFPILIIWKEHVLEMSREPEEAGREWVPVQVWLAWGWAGPVDPMNGLPDWGTERRKEWNERGLNAPIHELTMFTRHFGGAVMREGHVHVLWGGTWLHRVDAAQPTRRAWKRGVPSVNREAFDRAASRLWVDSRGLVVGTPVAAEGVWRMADFRGNVLERRIPEGFEDVEAVLWQVDEMIPFHPGAPPTRQVSRREAADLIPAEILLAWRERRAVPQVFHYPWVVVDGQVRSVSETLDD